MAPEIAFLLVHLGVEDLVQEFFLVQSVERYRFRGREFFPGLDENAVLLETFDEFPGVAG